VAVAQHERPAAAEHPGVRLMYPPDMSAGSAVMTQNPDAAGASPDAAPSASPRVIRKQIKRREEILRAAAAVFNEMGYHRTSLEDIAERLDLTRASLYHYFPGKDALLSACLEFGAHQAIARLTKVFDATAGDDPDARLAALIRAQLSIITRDAPELSRLFLNSMDWPDTFRVQARLLRHRHDQFFRAVIEDGRASGSFTCIDVEVAHRCLHGAVNYAAVWLKPYSDDFDRSVDAIAESLLLLFHAAPLPALTRMR
jgi:AcrR family transcriptional regulator